MSTEVDLSSTGLAKLQRTHSAAAKALGEICGRCRTEWPCLAAQLIAELVRLRAEHDEAESEIRSLMQQRDEALAAAAHARGESEW